MESFVNNIDLFMQSVSLVQTVNLCTRLPRFTPESHVVEDESEMRIAVNNVDLFV